MEEGPNRGFVGFYVQILAEGGRQLGRPVYSPSRRSKIVF